MEFLEIRTFRGETNGSCERTTKEEVTEDIEAGLIILIFLLRRRTLNARTQYGVEWRLVSASRGAKCTDDVSRTSTWRGRENREKYGGTNAQEKNNGATRSEKQYLLDPRDHRVAEREAPLTFESGTTSLRVARSSRSGAAISRVFSDRLPRSPIVLGFAKWSRPMMYRETGEKFVSPHQVALRYAFFMLRSNIAHTCWPMRDAASLYLLRNGQDDSTLEPWKLMVEKTIVRKEHCLDFGTELWCL